MKRPHCKPVSSPVDRVGEFEITEKVALQAALRTCESKGVTVRGPFITPKSQHIYLVDGWILTESELVALHQNQSLNREVFCKLAGNSEKLKDS